uniref:Uncharacterized protein n=1 Tax=Arundo donax TaxID=35708 RepID=A0A0A9BA55_ARUDO
MPPCMQLTNPLNLLLFI